MRRGKTLDFVKVRLLSRLLLFIGSLSFSVYILSREKESESVIVVSVSSVLDSLSLFVRVVLFLLKVWSKDHREERERIGGNIGKKNDDSKSNNNALFLSFP